MAVIDFNVDPYYDDFEGAAGAKSKKYHRVLFRPGFPVQARELTQLQSILQNQIERFGSHVFEEGSMVIPGDVAFDMEYDFIKVQSTFNAQNVESYRTDFVNKIITGSETGVKARVIGTVAATSSTPMTLYIKYEDSGTNNTTNTFSIGETVTSLNADNTQLKNQFLTADQTTEISASIRPTGTVRSVINVAQTDAGGLLEAGLNDTVGTGSAVRVNAGVYFVNGFFVANENQTILLEPYHNAPSYRVGWKVVQSTLTPEEDETLKDNAQGASNFAAPGAHRYKITLTLEKRALDATTDTNFIELGRVKNGTIQRFVKKADYNVLAEEFARRTYDESGDYEVKPFKVDVRESLISGNNRGIFTTLEGGLAENLALGIEPGKAYIQGYEVELQATRFLNVEKPRTFNRVVDTPIQTPIGNYVIVQNVTGMPEIDDYEEIYIYDDFVSGTPTAIGSCNVRSFMLHSGDYDDAHTGDTEFKFGIFDIVMNQGKDFTRDARAFGDNSTAASATFKCDISPKLVTLTGSATVGTGAVTVTGQGTLFNSQVSVGDRLYINDIDVGEVATITNNLSLNLTANGLAAITSGSVKRFSAEIIRPDRKILVFDTNYFRMRKVRGDSSATPDNVASTNYTVRRKFATGTVANANNGSVSFTAAGTEETFASTGNISNFTLIINTPAGGSARSAGDVLKITTSNLTLTGSDRTLNISDLHTLTDTPVTDGDTVDLIASVDVRGNDAVEKSKTLNLNETKQVTTQAEAQNTVIKLGKADGYRLVSIKMSADFSTNATASDLDITSRYDFDTGQKDAYYDLASIKLKSGNPAPSGRLLITFDYFTHGAGDYFSVDSYDGVIDYEDIPTYISSGTDGASYDLRDSLDFRPRIDDAGVSFTGSGSAKGELPVIGTNVEADFSYYLPRIDKVVANFDGEFFVVKGVPADDPKPPADLDKAMTLFVVSYQPYVLNTTEAIAKKINNKRYTMRDIGKLETRINNLELISSLNLLEKATTDLLVKDVNGNDRLKNGFIVDPFSGHGIGNVSNEDYRIAVDMKRKVARPMAHSDIVSLVETVSTDAERATSGYKKHVDGIITLPYSEVSYINNPYASDTMDVNAYKVSAFTGEMILTPASDDWKDTTRRPDLIVQDDNNFDAIQFLADEIGVEGTVWEGWQDNWFGATNQTSVRGGLERRSRFIGFNTVTTTTQEVGQINIGTETSLQSSYVNKSLGDKIVDLSLIPYMREIPIHVSVGNMKPRTKVQAFFDNVNVNAYVLPDEKLTVTSTNRTDFQFTPMADPGSQADTDSARFWDSFDQNSGSWLKQPFAAFGFGDVVRNQVHTPTTVTNVTQVGNVTTITLASVNGIAVGHMVTFANIGGAIELNYDGVNDNRYFVESVNTGTNQITIIQIDYNNSPVSALTAYTSGGTATRLQASGVVSYQRPDDPNGAANAPVDINITNRQNGFAIGDVLTGTLLNNAGNINQCTITAVNDVTDATSTDVYKKLQKFGGDKITDDDGSFNGVFVVPNNASTQFRTGERVFRLIDNISNNLDYGTHSTKAERIFHASGLNEEREETILSVRQAEFVRDRVQQDRVVTRSIGVSSRFTPTRRIGHDPLAQTFVVQDVIDGAMITKVDLFFSARGTRPLIVQLLNTKDGNPSGKILAQKTIPASAINTSDDATVSTTISFDSPVFMQQDATYALVLKADEPGMRVFFSEVGKTNIGDGRIVSQNPLTGTMFLSQNGGTWTPFQTRDLKFTLHRAEFSDAVGQINFQNSRNGYTTLRTDPFETTTGSNKVRVYQRNHGFVAGNKVSIAGVPSGFYGANSTSVGIPHTELNGQHTVVAPVTTDTYVIEVTEANIADGGAYPGTEADILSADFVGGAGVRATRNLPVDVITPTVTQLKFANTSLTYDLNIGNTNGVFTGLQNIAENDITYFTDRKSIMSYDNQSTAGYSAQLRATLFSSNSFVSPVIDSQRVSLCTVANRIDNLTASGVNVADFDNRTVASANTHIAYSATNSTITTTNATLREEFDTLDIGKEITTSGSGNASNDKTYIITNYKNDGTTSTITVSPAPGVDESATSAITLIQAEKFIHDIAPVGATNLANYVTRRFTLENSSTAIKILYEMNRPAGTTVDVYYKVLPDGDEATFDTIPYVQTTTEIPDSPDENQFIFRERTHLVENLNGFSSIAVKLVFKSTNPASVPQIKNLRVLALAV
jgi:hypothetical protein